MTAESWHLTSILLRICRILWLPLSPCSQAFLLLAAPVISLYLMLVTRLLPVLWSVRKIRGLSKSISTKVPLKTHKSLSTVLGSGSQCHIKQKGRLLLMRRQSPTSKISETHCSIAYGLGWVKESIRSLSLACFTKYQSWPQIMWRSYAELDMLYSFNPNTWKKKYLLFVETSKLARFTNIFRPYLKQTK